MKLKIQLYEVTEAAVGDNQTHNCENALFRFLQYSRARTRENNVFGKSSWQLFRFFRFTRATFSLKAKKQIAIMKLSETGPSRRPIRERKPIH